VLQRVPLRFVPLHVRFEGEKRQEAEDSQTAFFEILIFCQQPLSPFIKGNYSEEQAGHLSIDV
jgi:hypothetical protein